jgi:hypothetical protein
MVVEFLRGFESGSEAKKKKKPFWVGHSCVGLPQGHRQKKKKTAL